MCRKAAVAYTITTLQLGETLCQSDLSRHVLQNIVLSKCKNVTEKPPLHLIANFCVTYDSVGIAELVSTVDSETQSNSLSIEQNGTHPWNS